MGGVLIDDDDPFIRLSNDIGLVKLGPGGSERIMPVIARLVYRFGCGRRCDVAPMIRLIQRPMEPMTGLRQRRVPRHRRRHAAAGGLTGQEPGPRRIGRPHGAEGRRTDRGGGPMSGFGERMLEGADDQPPNQTRIAEPHLGLRRMGIDVDRLGRDFKEQRQQGVPVVGEKIPVGGANRALQQLVPHRPAVDEQELHLRVAAIQRRQADMTGQLDAVPRRLDGQGVGAEVVAHDGIQTVETRREEIPLRRRQFENLAFTLRQGKGDPGMRHGQTPHGVNRMVALGLRGLEKLEARRRRIEKIANLDPGARRMGRRLRPRDRSAFDVDFPGAVGVGRAAGNGQPGNGADGWQCLAPESQGMDVLQVFARQFGSRMALNRKRQVVGVHSVAVIGDRQGDPSAIGHHDVDTPGTRVDAVLDQLLDRGGRPLHHLAGGDLVDQIGTENADGHWISSCPAPWPRYSRARTFPCSTAG